ncbi:MAG: diguanylate cyclase (GGDEF)-like protein [Gammaproteobacteria bacterium]|jgi:diguanylate cyclase (GGDEF)-like protein
MFYHRLQQEIRHANRSNQGVALLYLDLDQFKEVNDTLGHERGDQLLMPVSEQLLCDVCEVDAVARPGGDECTIMLGGLADLSSVERVADGILAKLSEPFQLDDESASISSSIRISFYSQDAQDADAMLKNADQAMYAAKRRGRN